jgi:hypothetical protein
MKKLSLALGLAVVLGLQGCGGGGSSDSSSNDSGTSKSSVSKTKTSGSTSKKRTPVMNSLDSDKATDSISDDSTKATDVTSEADSLSSIENYYILKKKTIKFLDHNETTIYDLNASSSSYIAKSTMTSSDGEKVEKKYDFNKTSKTLNVYVKNIIDEWELTQVAKFETGKAKDIVDFKKGNNSYMINTFDPIQFFNMRVVKNIKDIEKELFNVYTYKYGANGTIKSITEGYLDSLADTNMTVVKENVLSKNLVEVQVEPNFSDDNKTVTKGNTTYEFEVFENVMINDRSEG